jgi:hypothetical protein
VPEQDEEIEEIAEMKGRAAPAARKEAVVPRAKLAPPPRRNRVLDDEDDDRDWDDDDDRPRKRRRSPAVLVLVGLGIALFVLLAAGGTVTAVWLLNRNKETASSSSSADDDKLYTIVINEDHNPDVGKSVVKSSTKKNVTKAKYFDAKGKFLKDLNQEETDEEQYTEVVLEKGDRHSKKFKRIYTKASTTAKGQTKVRSYQGRTVIFDLLADQTTYEVKADGPPPLNQKDQQELVKRSIIKPRDDLSASAVFLPGKAVRIDQEWNMDKSRVKEWIWSKAAAAEDPPEDLDLQVSAAKGKLVKAYTKDGHQYGVLELTISYSMRADFGNPAKDPVEATMSFTVDGPIDGSRGIQTATMSIIGKFKMQIPGDNGQTITANVTSEISGTDVAEDK